VLVARTAWTVRIVGAVFSAFVIHESGRITYWNLSSDRKSMDRFCVELAACRGMRIALRLAAYRSSVYQTIERLARFFYRELGLEPGLRAWLCPGFGNDRGAKGVVESSASRESRVAWPAVDGTKFLDSRLNSSRSRSFQFQRWWATGSKMKLRRKVVGNVNVSLEDPPPAWTTRRQNLSIVICQYSFVIEETRAGK